MDSGAFLNPGPYACTTRILLTKPSAQPSPNLSETDTKFIWEARASIRQSQGSLLHILIETLHKGQDGSFSL